MSTQHTPGPWEYLPEEEGFAGAVTAKTGWICDFAADPSPANARLIAAAPCMLKKLCSLRDYIAASILALEESHKNPSTGLIDDPEALLAIEAEQDRINSIDALILKATGGQA